MFASLVEISSSMTSSRILGEFPNSKFHFLKIFNDFIWKISFFEKATNNIGIIRHNLGYNEAHVLHVKQPLVVHK